MSPQEAIKHLSVYADGLDVAADCERRIDLAYTDEEKRWDHRPVAEKPDDMLNRRIRVMLDARENARRIQKDADALRVLLHALSDRLNVEGPDETR